MAATPGTIRQCIRCDSSVPADAHFCVECGTPIDGAVAAQAQPIQAERCRVCHGANPTRATFCVHCGAALHGPAFVGDPPRSSVVGSAVAGSPMQQFYIINHPHPPIPLIVRALWFIFVGLWLGQLWLAVGWLLNLSVIGLPLGLWMLNRTGHVMTLRPMPSNQPTNLAVSHVNLVVRGIYFVLIGWWVSLLWLLFGWLAAATVIGLPVAFLMFEHTGTVATLADA